MYWGFHSLQFHIFISQHSTILNTKCREVTSMVKVLIINVTWHVPQNRASDTITHVTLNTINNVVVSTLNVHQIFNRGYKYFLSFFILMFNPKANMNFLFYINQSYMCNNSKCWFKHSMVLKHRDPVFIALLLYFVITLVQWNICCGCLSGSTWIDFERNLPHVMWFITWNIHV